MSWGLLTSILDVFRLSKLFRSWVCTRPYEQLKSSSKTQSTSELLQDLGLSPSIVNQFLRPFFEAIYVSPVQEHSAAMFNFVLRMLAVGGAALPERGMGAIPEQLASTLRGKIRLSTPVEAVRPSGVKVAGDWMGFDAVVVATDWPAACAFLKLEAPRATQSSTWYFGLQSPAPVTDPLIILQTYGQKSQSTSDFHVDRRVVNIGFPSTVQSSYAPSNHALAAVTAVGPKVDEAWIRSEIERILGVDCSGWQLLRSYSIGFHQPEQVPLKIPEDLDPCIDGIFCCGDHRSYPALDGAMRSGRIVAEAVLKRFADEGKMKQCTAQPASSSGCFGRWG
jgi:hypothetical protein